MAIETAFGSCMVTIDGFSEYGERAIEVLDAQK